MKKDIFVVIIKFWLINIIFPFLLILLLSKYDFTVISTLLIDYILFVAPIIFIILPFRKIKNRVSKPWVTVLIYLIIPYVFIYILAIYGIYKSWENFGF